MRCGIFFFSFSFFRGKAAEEPPGASAVAASIYQRFSFLHAGLDLGQLLLLLLCGDSTESAKQSTKAGVPQRNQDGGDQIKQGKLALPPSRAEAAVHLREREAEASQYCLS